MVRYTVTTKNPSEHQTPFQINTSTKTNNKAIYLEKDSLIYLIYVSYKELQVLTNKQPHERVEQILNKLKLLDYKRYEQIIKW